MELEVLERDRGNIRLHKLVFDYITSVYSFKTFMKTSTLSCNIAKK